MVSAESSSSTRFVSTEQLATWLTSKTSKELVVLSVNASPPTKDFDTIEADFAQGHIPSSKLFDVHLLKD